MDVLREREVKDSLERQLQDEQKVRGEYRRACDFTWAYEKYRARCMFLARWPPRIEAGLTEFTVGTPTSPPFCAYGYEKIDLIVDGRGARAIRDTRV